MKLFLPILFAVLAIFAVLAPVLSQHCGVFRMRCDNAAGACNNACYYINCLNGGNNTFVYGPLPGLDNRVECGCKTTGKALCTAELFAQRIYDQSDAPVSIFGRRLGKWLDCDEFPMAAFQQPAFVPGGRPRNSLRCIPARENHSGGANFLAFKQGHGNWAPGKGALASDRTCAGSLHAGDDFRMEFITAGIPAHKHGALVPYCKPNPDCANDGLQLHMTALNKGRGKTGRFHKAYSYPFNNQYSLSGAGNIWP